MAAAVTAVVNRSDGIHRTTDLAPTVNWFSTDVTDRTAASMHPLLPENLSLCPLCHGPNGCAMAAGLPSQSCWCMNAKVSEQALAALPPNAAGRQCICRHCAADTCAPGTDSSADQPPI